jgi:hypothetical protein
MNKIKFQSNFNCKAIWTLSPVWCNSTISVMKISIYLSLSVPYLCWWHTAYWQTWSLSSTSMSSQWWWNFWYSVFLQNTHLLVFLAMYRCLWQLQTLWTPIQSQNVHFPHFLHLSVGWMLVMMKTYLSEETINKTLEVIATESRWGTWWSYHQKGHMEGFWDSTDSILITLHGCYKLFNMINY